MPDSVPRRRERVRGGRVPPRAGWDMRQTAPLNEAGTALHPSRSATAAATQSPNVIPEARGQNAATPDLILRLWAYCSIGLVNCLNLPQPLAVAIMVLAHAARKR
jgi:hypothetical protein